MAEREEKARRDQRKPAGRPPQPPEDSGPRDNDQYNFTDPESRIMKNSQNAGYDQHYNVQLAVDQGSLLIVAQSLSNHRNDKQESAPPWMPCYLSLASHKPWPWTMVTLVKRPSMPVN